MRGGGKKPYKQKGTGNARQGSTRAPHFVGGGKVFGPQPRDYAYTVPKKVKRAALRSALSLRAKEKKLVIVDASRSTRPRPSTLAGILKTLGAETALVVDGKANANLVEVGAQPAQVEVPRPRGPQRLRHPQPPEPRDRRRTPSRRSRRASGQRPRRPRKEQSCVHPNRSSSARCSPRRAPASRRPAASAGDGSIPRTLKSQLLFEVARDANKIEIRHAVEKLCNVNVVDVRTPIVRGKEKRMGRFIGKRSELEEGHRDARSRPDTIEFFEGV